MNYTDLFFIAVGILLIAVCLFVFRKSKRFFSSLFLSAVSGLGGLLAVNLISSLTAVAIPLNSVSVIFSCLTGLSGVISLILWQIILY